MTNDPQPSTRSLDAQSVRQLRWLAGGIWLALLAGLLLTSYAGIVGPMSNIDLALIQLENFQGLDRESSPNGDLIASIALIITALIALWVLALWILFGRATAALLEALSDAGEDEIAGPTPSVWLSSTPQRSGISDMVMLGGLAWALLILRPVLIAALRLLTG